MADRLVTVDENSDLPEAVVARLAATLGGTGGGGGGAGGTTVLLPDGTVATELRLVVIGQGAAPVTPTPDTTRPSNVSGLTATAGNGQVVYGWAAATDNVAVTGYRIYRAGTLVASPTGTSYTLTGLTNGTAVNDVTVTAVDAAGNESATPATFPAATPTAGAANPAPQTTWLDNFATTADGAFPTGWTPIWLTTSSVFTVQPFAAASDGRALSLMNTGTNAAQRAMRWDTPGISGDQEVVMKWQTGELVRAAAPLLHGLGLTTGEASGYGAGYRGSTGGNTYQVTEQTGTTVTSVAEVPVSPAHALNTWYITRSQIRGATIRTRTWQHGTTEPSTWQVEYVDPTPQPDGYVGLFIRQVSTSIPVWVDWVGAATGSSTAPVGA